MKITEYHKFIFEKHIVGWFPTIALIIFYFIYAKPTIDNLVNIVCRGINF